MADREAESLLRQLSELPPDTAAVVMDIGHARFADPALVKSPKRPLLGLPEDLWVPHVVALIEDIERISVERNLRLVVDLEHRRPHRNELLELLHTTRAVTHLSGTDGGKAPAIDDVASAWSEWASKGLLGKIIHSIDELPGFGEDERTVLRAQLFLLNGITAESTAHIEKLGLKGIRESDVAVQLAQIACDSGALLLARDILNHVVGQIRSMEALEIGLQVAWRIKDASLASTIAQKLQDNFPSNQLNIRHRLRVAHVKRDYVTAAIEAKQLPDASEEAAAYEFLSRELSEQAVPNYPEIHRRIASRQGEWSTLAQDALVRDALSRGLVIHALEIVELVLDGRFADKRTVLTTLDAIEQITIARQPGNDELVIDPERLSKPLNFILRYISQYPGDVYVYSRFRQLLSVEGSGRYGEVAMIYILVQGINEPTLLTQNEPERGIPIEQLHKRLPVFESAFRWLTENGPTVLGKTRLPQSLFTDEPRALLASITDLVAYYEGRVKDDLDIVAIRNWLGLGLSIAPYVEASLQDLRLLYGAAGIFMRSTRQQEARDFCRQAFILAGKEAQRRRLAWVLNADVYKAGGDTLSSLIAINCARHVECSVDPQDAWQEANLLTRTLRDLKLFELASEAHRVAGEVLQDLGKAERMKLQHEYLGLTVDALGALRDPHIKHEALQQVLAKATWVASLALMRNDSRAPIAILLGQLINIADSKQIPVSHETREAQGSLMLDDSALDPVTVALAAQAPTISDLLSVHRLSERARYAADAAYDVRHTTAIATRFLNAPQSLKQPENVAFAIELLGDRAVAKPGWRSNADPVPSIEDVATVSKVVAEVSARGTTLIMVGLNGSGELVRVDCVAGSLGPASKETLGTFSRQALTEWSKKYPYGYADDDAHANVFYLSTESLKFSPLPLSPSLVVASTSLQSFPLNLWRVDQEFAGLTHGLVSTPSLSWLRSALAKQTTKEHPKRAWISAGDERGVTLNMVSERLQETFLEHGIALDPGTTLPSDFVDAKLAVVTAHGGIAPGGKSYFTRISDEGELSVTARELSKALRNVEVVILFVCSGGRIDKDPTGETVAGMAKHLFDAGCSAVIASPWPLDPRVTYHWLPSFLAAWKLGSNLADANLQANQNVERNFPGDFAKSLAMHVYGNPFIAYN